MENLDVIILTIVVVISFVVFIFSSVQEFIRMEGESWKYEKATGPSRVALFNALSALFEDDEIPRKDREELKKAIKRSISDMETDGVYFDKTKKKSPK
ncbi:hypothetical protein Q4534_02585 [Cyclobacterium sp. 1_MG-2023]|uniref:hypothetical protein n=1 Tax=Cyclobacterium sp. 1_MG-2023 TaxID=3062681 RepID=UPI0026E45775|nr:hypothetical protein [Cyclobacterium sp. 1_MG-2023]MDO6436273.1 hypothetical protein [Cyclobacterium sp. 1_MG-2023]